MVRHAREDPPQPVLRHPETEPLLQHLRALLEDDHLQPLAHALHVRPRPIPCQGRLADDQHVVRRQIRRRIHALEADLQRLQQRARLASGIEEGDSGGVWCSVFGVGCWVRDFPLPNAHHRRPSTGLR